MCEKSIVGREQQQLQDNDMTNDELLVRQQSGFWQPTQFAKMAKLCQNNVFTMFYVCMFFLFYCKPTAVCDCAVMRRVQ